MRLAFKLAAPEDAMAIAALRNAAAADLAARFGRGHWSGAASERGVLAGMRASKVFVARQGRRILGTVALATKKPWAIDRAYFATSTRPLYLIDMAVSPDRQRRGIGRECIERVIRIARDWPADAIRLDAYDAEAGAGEFYRKCGFREVGRVTHRTVPLIYFEMQVG